MPALLRVLLRTCPKPGSGNFRKPISVSPASVFSEILSGGPPRDGIPGIDDPHFLPVSDVGSGELADREPVISVVIGNRARAYPLRVLMWHEIVNDIFNDRPLAVTYCPLCDSAVVFDRVVGGQVLDFGTTGRLRHSDLVMYDRQTESWWQQFSGEGIIGAYTGTMLKILPSRTEAYLRFKNRFPDGEVLVPDARLRNYGVNPYRRYDTAATPFFVSGRHARRDCADGARCQNRRSGLVAGVAA